MASPAPRSPGRRHQRRLPPHQCHYDRGEAAPQDWIVLERLIRFTARRQPAPPRRAQTDRPETTAGGQAPRPHLPAPRDAGYLLARSHDPEPPRPAARPLRRVRARGQPDGQVGITLATYDNVVPGGYLESCFENHGSASITSTATSLERFANGTWRSVAVGPQYSPAQTAIQRTLGPGEAERIGTLIPPNAQPGLYKLIAAGTVPRQRRTGGHRRRIRRPLAPLTPRIRRGSPDPLRTACNEGAGRISDGRPDPARV